MHNAFLLDTAREALSYCLLLGGPLLLTAMMMGTLAGALQAITQVQDTTLSLIPKLLGVGLAIFLLLPFFLEHLLDWSARLLGELPSGWGGG